MKASTLSWQEMFIQQRQAELGWGARSYSSSEVHSLSDEEVLLTGVASLAARSADRPLATKSVPPKLVIITPQEKNEALSSFRSRIVEARRLYPLAELAGFAPTELPIDKDLFGLDRGVFMIGKAAKTFSLSSSAASYQEVARPLTAVLVYTPDVSPQALEEAVLQLGQVSKLVSVAALPAGAGDRIPLPGLTTSGSTDMMVISALRILLAPNIRVRVSWAALGWKVAQLALAYGADEIIGVSAAEALAYGARNRAMSHVERAELDRGLAEARCTDLGWMRGE